MGFIGPKTLLKWREPKRIRRAKDRVEERARRPWQRPLAVLAFALVIGLIIVGSALLEGKFNPKPSGYLIGLAVLLGLGVFLVYVVPVLVGLVPAEVRIHEKGVARQVGNTGTDWPFEKIEGFQITSTAAGGEQLLVLSLRLQDGEAQLGIAPDVKTDQVRQLLVEHGIGEVTEDGDTHAGGSMEPEPHDPSVEADTL